jgi:hypothetical protein
MKIEPLSLPDLMRAAGLSIAASAQWKTPIAAQTLSGVWHVRLPANGRGCVWASVMVV